MKVYIGDSVYVDFDGYSLILTTENGFGPTNTIYMEPSVCEALKLYVDRLKTNTPSVANGPAPAMVDETDVVP